MFPGLPNLRETFYSFSRLLTSTIQANIVSPFVLFLEISRKKCFLVCSPANIVSWFANLLEIAASVVEFNCDQNIKCIYTTNLRVILQTPPTT